MIPKLFLVLALVAASHGSPLGSAEKQRYDGDDKTDVLSDFRECMQTPFKIDSEKLIHPPDLTDRVGAVEKWKAYTCRVNIIPETTQFASALDKCEATSGLRSGVVKQERKIYQKYDDFCAADASDAVCHDLFNYTFPEFTFDKDTKDVCDVHAELGEYFEDLFRKCPEKRARALRAAEFNVYGKYMALVDDEREGLDYSDAEECREMRKPKVYNETEFYVCVFDCARQKEKRDEASGLYLGSNMHLAEYCNLSFTQTHSSCFESCSETHPALAEKMQDSAEKFTQMCQPEFLDGNGCKFEKNILKKDPTCTHLSNLQKTLKNCLRQEHAGLFLDEFALFKAKNDVGKYSGMKACFLEQEQSAPDATEATTETDASQTP